MRNLCDLSHVVEAFNSEMKQLKGGVFVKKAIEDWKKKTEGKLKKKIYLYSAHDTTVADILSAFNVWEKQFPDYGIAAIFELSQHRNTQEYGVEVSLIRIVYDSTVITFSF